MGISEILTISTAALAVSEGLALIPGMKSNSIFQLIFLILKAIVNGIKSKEV
mgnify:CR=1 FL=1